MTNLAFRNVIAGAILVAAVCAAGTAHATYPGNNNGRVAFGMTVEGNTDVYSVRPDGRALRRLTDDPGFDACPAYSADGESIAWCGPGGVWLMNQDGTEKRQVTTFGAFPDISPDGSKILFGGAPVGSTNAEVWVVDADGGNLTQLTAAVGPDRFPAWSPDGTKIVFQSARTGMAQIWVMNGDGTDQTQLTFDLVPKDQVPDWSPDGSRIAFITSGADKLGTAWAPDGTAIATLDWPSRTVEIMAADGTGAQTVRQGGVQFVPGWQPRGTGFDELEQ
jgi:Tol biopolymer transport system component